LSTVNIFPFSTLAINNLVEFEPKSIEATFTKLLSSLDFFQVYQCCNKDFHN